MVRINHKTVFLMFMGVFLFLGNTLMVDALSASINEYDPKPALVGEYINVWFEVEEGTFQEDEIYIEVIPQDGLELTVGEDPIKYLGTLSGSEIVKYRFRVKDGAIEGQNKVIVNLYQGDPSFSSAATKEELYIDVKDTAAELAIGDVYSEPTRMKPDDEDVRLVAVIQNLGEGLARSVRAELRNLPEGITFSDSYSGESLVGNIEGNDLQIAEFYIDVDINTKPKEYYADLVLNYKSETGEGNYDLKELTLPIKVAVKPIPIYSISDISFDTESIRAGQKNVKMKLTLENIGEEKGESVRIKVFTKTEQPFTFDITSDFVAPTLHPGESGQATLEFDIDETANLQKYFLELEVKNVVGNDVITQEIKAPVNIEKGKKNNVFLFVFIGLVLLGGYAYYYFRIKDRRRHTKRKTAEAKGHYGKSYLDLLAQKKKRK